jgi:predicted dehydrogenase
LRVLLSRGWVEGFLDEACEEDTVRIAVSRWLPIAGVHGLFVERDPSFRRIIDYMWECGARATILKVLSRREERYRNQRYVCVGAGVIVADARVQGSLVGEPVAFLAPRHPLCVERVVLDRRLVRVLKSGRWPPNRISVARPRGGWPATDPVAGWDARSGEALDEALVEEWLDYATKVATGRESEMKATYSFEGASPVRERLDNTVGCDARQVIVFGYGNYVKSVVLPEMTKHLRVTCVHELDPLQVGLRSRGVIAWDTSPGLRRFETPRVTLVAGYHHTHAGTAIEALRGDGDVIVEKPLVTSGKQLEALAMMMSTTKGRLFVAYQRRYWRFNAFVADDLAGGPISYHAIVYEEDLPQRHWYRWRASGTSVLSNGCHWIDHFLWLNPDADVVKVAAEVGYGRAVSVFLELSTGAVCTLAITHTGSPRLGVREITQLRAGATTAEIRDGRFYVAEGPRGIMRKAKVTRLDAYEAMYAAICRRIRSVEPGDDWVRERRSAEAILAVEAAVQSSIASRVPEVP